MANLIVITPAVYIGMVVIGTGQAPFLTLIERNNYKMEVLSLNRKVLAIIVLGIVSILVMAGVSYAVSPQEQARIAAEEGLPMLLKNIVEPEYQLFYFSNKDEVMRATLGTPLENFTIAEGSFDEGKSVAEQMKPYPFYVFPLIVDGRVTTDLTVAL